MADLNPEQDQALRTARMLLALGHPVELVVSNSLIPEPLRAWVSEVMDEEGNRTFAPAKLFTARQDKVDWLAGVDRNDWHYWPTLRSFLLVKKGWPRDTVWSLDDTSDRVLRELEPPSTLTFDIRGLVLGYVQSGKTANFTAVAAKAADAGYRLIIVLSGMDNGLRRQTQLRLNRELTGYSHNPPDAVQLPPVGKRWHQFTTDELSGDFHPGRANHAALQGSQPVLLVVKKNGPVLRRLRAWLQSAPEEVRTGLATLFIDDEADQASIDTRGSYQNAEAFNQDNPEYETPAAINGLIRELLNMFAKRAYVAYTATPFANILIPHDGFDSAVGSDLYPKDFIIDLPKPKGYFGAEEFFGRLDALEGEQVDGLDVLRIVTPEQMVALAENGEVTQSLDDALCAFVLGGAARAFRGKGDAPSTMLVHTSQRIADQAATKLIVEQRFFELRDEWRYDRKGDIRGRLKTLWDTDFIPTTRGVAGRVASLFAEIETFIGPFFEAVVVREINSDTGDVLDYEREPALKAIAVGGNRLARGLTLEGLLVSYFARRTLMYDTLMQMGRWFGYRGEYEDLTRIYTTAELAEWFADLAQVEHRLRQDLEDYENLGLRPHELGMRILTHPTMQVTSALKRRFTEETVVSQSYSAQLEQTFKFPFSNASDLSMLSEQNRLATMAFLGRLSKFSQAVFGPLWIDVAAADVVGFIRDFRIDSKVNNLSLNLIAAWIERQNTQGELVNWTVVVRGRESEGNGLGSATWLPTGCGSAWNLSRTRIRGTNSMGVITTSGDEAFGLSERETNEMNRKLTSGEQKDKNRAARLSRSAQCGLLILYPISKFSGHGDKLAPGREPLFSSPFDGACRDMIGMALSLPQSAHPQPVEAYLAGSAWRLRE